MKARLYRFPTEQRMTKEQAPERIKKIMEQTKRLEDEAEYEAAQQRLIKGFQDLIGKSL